MLKFRLTGNDSVMGKKGGWLSSLKKTFSPSSKEKKRQVFYNLLQFHNMLNL